MQLRVVLGLLALLGLCGMVLGRSATAEPGDAQAGRGLYIRLCASCHGVTGQGGRMGAMLSPPPRNLADQAYMHGRSEQQLFEVIQQGGAAVGLSAAMNAFGNQLNTQQIWDVVAYVRTFAAPANAAAPPLSATARPPEAPAGDLSMARLRLSVWPEYDDPRVLVILRGEMAPAQAFPTRIGLPLPKGAEIIGAGMISEQNELLVHPHQVLPGDGQDRLEMQLPVPRFFLEFYYNPFTTTGAAKRLAYTVALPYPITVLEVDVQQPSQSSEFVLTPPPAESSTDERGLTYHQFVYHNVAAGQGPTFTIAYTKTARTPSVAQRQMQPQPPAPMHPTQVRVRRALVGGSVLVGAIVLCIGWAWLTRRSRSRARSVASEAVPPGSLAEAFVALVQHEATPVAAPVNFCTDCGRKLLPEDRFCADCGKLVQR